ncbi:glycosyltransferase family 1 protein [Blastomonas sp.]|uniref:glycosyltransferase family 4 protein n=1 Tax=Blastomonas sp. TaxID=1909299 RepID=UPI00263114D9|nr:glycosyltransferase family 1 protein [Blastomonas sp.]MDM7957570.1 glycosyltransferase family 1 protein [Blastomonas sp.]
MKIAIVTDAWAPQVNGVVRTLSSVTERLRGLGHDVLVVSPDQYASIPCPSYPEIRLALATRYGVGAQLTEFAPDAVHIATEGPLGIAARRFCLNHGHPFTTAYHTQFPDYLARRTGLPAAMFWPFIRWFHAPAASILVSTETVRQQLREQGLHQVVHWGRGVDLACFTPSAAPPALYAGLPRPIQLYVGRVAVEKNIEAFLASDHPGSKVVVGDGPARETLARAYPHAHFVGAQSGEALAGHYAGADVFVFPSRTDTFGLVMIEAMACGTPVAAFPVSGPLDVLGPASGVMHEDLKEAIAGALLLDRNGCAEAGRGFTWEASTRQFLSALVPIAAPEALAA